MCPLSRYAIFPSSSSSVIVSCASAAYQIAAVVLLSWLRQEICALMYIFHGWKAFMFSKRSGFSDNEEECLSRKMCKGIFILFSPANKSMSLNPISFPNSMRINTGSSSSKDLSSLPKGFSSWSFTLPQVTSNGRVFLISWRISKNDVLTSWSW